MIDKYQTNPPAPDAEKSTVGITILATRKSRRNNTTAAAADVAVVAVEVVVVVVVVVEVVVVRSQICDSQKGGIHTTSVFVFRSNNYHRKPTSPELFCSLSDRKIVAKKTTTIATTSTTTATETSTNQRRHHHPNRNLTLL